MNRLSYPFFYLLISLILFGCRPEIDFVESSLRPGVAEASFSGGTLSMVFSSSAGSASVDLTASGAWTATFVNDRAKDWCSISTSEGKRGTATITVSVKENPDYEQRSASINFVCGDVKRSIVLTQKQKEGLLVTSNRIDVGQSGGRITVEVKANISFDYAVSESAKSWITAVRTKGLTTTVLSFDVSANDKVEKREGEIMVTGSAGREVVKVYQEGETPTLVLSQNRYELTREAQEIRVEVRHNVDVVMEIPSDCDWVSEIGTKSLSTSTFCLIVSENKDVTARSCRLRFRSPAWDLAEEVVVEQAAAAPQLLIDDTLSCYGVGGLVSFKTAGMNADDYSFDCVDGWLSVSGWERVSDSIRFLVDVQPQTVGSEPRDGQVLVYCAGYAIPDTLWIHQYERYPALFYTSSSRTVIVPVIDGGEQCAGIVWGDGFQEPYKLDLVHGYSLPGSHTVAIEIRENKQILFENLENGMEMDFRELR